MKNLLLSVALVALPVGLFAGVYSVLVPSADAQASAPIPEAGLGDMSGFVTIITDVSAIAATGDFAAAKARITDFETAWDDAAGTLRPMNTLFWGNVDIAADAALDALRAGTPDAATVTATLADLSAELADPSKMPGAAPVAGVASVGGIATTDANGRALPCEVMLKDLAGKLATATIPAATLTRITNLQTKALERCNADDDARADGFTAEALALIPAN